VRRLAGELDEVGADPAVERDRSPQWSTSVPRPLRGWGGLLAAAVAGLLLSQVLPSGGSAPEEPAPAAGPRLALVVGGQPVFNAAPGPDPSISVEVALVNTGSEPVRLTGAVAEGLALRWTADELLGAGEQTVVVLQEGNACARVAQQPQGSGGGQELRVAVGGPADELPDEVVLPLPLSVVRQYDDFARSSCGLPSVAQGLDVLPEPPSFYDGAVLIPVGLVSQTVQRLTLVDVAPTVPGVTAELRDPTGAVVPLPVGIPGRYLVDLDIGLGPGVPEIDRYVVSVRISDDGCAALRDPQVRASQLVRLFWIADDEPIQPAATTLGDAQEAVRLACA
jgi:hypothetical protein